MFCYRKILPLKSIISLKDQAVLGRNTHNVNKDISKLLSWVSKHLHLLRGAPAVHMKLTKECGEHEAWRRARGASLSVIMKASVSTNPLACLADSDFFGFLEYKILRILGPLYLLLFPE